MYNDQSIVLDDFQFVVFAAIIRKHDNSQSDFTKRVASPSPMYIFQLLQLLSRTVNCMVYAVPGKSQLLKIIESRMVSCWHLLVPANQNKMYFIV